MDSSTTGRTQEQAVISHYASLAPKYDRRWDRYTRVSLGTLLEHLSLDESDQVLDTGCGTGRLGTMMRERHSGIRITGTDLSPDMIEVARRRLPEDALTSWQVASTESMPFDDESFDVVTCANAFHLIPGQEKAMREMVRVLKPGGTLCIVDWCREYPQVFALLGVTRIFGRQYRSVLTREELRAMMERAGLNVSAATSFKATWFWGLMCLVGTRDRSS